MPFFDFHLHPSLKTMFSPDAARISPWKDIDISLIPLPMTICSDFNYILCSQSNLRQLAASRLNLACVALYAPERGMTRDRLFLQSARGSLKPILSEERLAYINKDSTSPMALVLDDLKNVLLNTGRFEDATRKVQPLVPGIAYDPDSTDTLFVVFTVEGAHSLANSFDPEKISSKEVIDNLDSLMERYPVLSINPTHLVQYPFCNHAYGILFLDNDSFEPRGNGFTEMGIELVRACYQRGVCVDTKHMSLGSRQDLINKIRQLPDFAAINQPLVCTHTGFTGIGMGEIADYIELGPNDGKASRQLTLAKPKRYASNDSFVAFNPSSINLFNEEIYQILLSGGIIGLSLDKRILGYTEPDLRDNEADELILETEFVSEQELGLFESPVMGAKRSETFCIQNKESQKGGSTLPKAAYYHLCHFMAHILHLVAVARQFGYPPESALRQVCIGSDFDGIINPVWCCPSTEQLPAFKQSFIDEFPGFAADHDSISRLPDGFDIHDFAECLFYKNGRDFVLGRLAHAHKAPVLNVEGAL